MPAHIKFLLKHALIGAFVALGFVGLLLWLDVLGLWQLVSGSADGILALGVMTVFFIITFSSVQMGIAVMGLQEKDSQPPRGPKLGVMSEELMPQRVRSSEGRG